MPELIPKRREIDATKLDGSWLLFDGGTLHLLNPSASLIWDSIDGCRSERSIAWHLSRSVSVPPAKLHEDVAKCVAALVAAGLVVTRTATTAVDQSYSVESHIAHTRDDDSIVIANLLTGRRYTLTGAGAVLWAALLKNGDPEAMLDEVRAAYPAAPATAESELRALLKDLEEQDLISRTRIP